MRRAINLITRFTGLLNRNRKLEPAIAFPVKVNLGSGLAVAPGWINIDGSLNALVASWPRFAHRWLYRLSGAKHYYTIEDYCALLRGHQFVHHDLTYGIPLSDACVDYVYTSHFLEHLHKEGAAGLLRESFRVLKWGGVLRVCIPDLAFAVSLYQRGDKEKMLDTFFFVSEDESDLARHKYMYDFELLSDALRKAGFARIERAAFRSGRTPDLSTLDRHPEQTLFVEAIKE